jgi:tetratricopeptide (TPR) repeat protein
MLRRCNPAWLAVLALACAGCSFGQYEDPNSVANKLKDPELMLSSLDERHAQLVGRVQTGEITDEEKDALMLEAVTNYADAVDEADITTANAYGYAELYRRADNWERSREIYAFAIEEALTESRRVIDTLQYARVCAHLDDMDAALEAAWSVFETAPEHKESILPAVLYEILEEGWGKEKDDELLKLLRAAIDQHTQAVIDVSEERGRQFLQAKPFHLRAAWNRLAQLQRELGNWEEARTAIEEADAMSQDFATL